MTLAEVLGALAGRGVELARRGDGLVLLGPPGTIDGALREAVRAHKAQLLARLERADRERAGTVRPSGSAGASHRPSPGQERLWFLDAVYPRSTAYLITAALHLSGPLDVARFQHAVGSLIDRHEALRTYFREVNGRPVAAVAELAPPRPTVTDLSALLEPERSRHYLQACRRVCGVGFALDQPPLWRWELMRLADEEHALLAALHHSIADGWSLANALREVAEWYAEPVPRPVPPELIRLRYADYAGWQHAHAAGPAGERQRRYWRDRLAGFPYHLHTPTDFSRPARASQHGDRVPVRLETTLVAAVRAAARAQRVSLPVFLMAAFGLLLRRWTGQRRFLIGMAVSNRPQAAFRPVFGFFVNWLPVPMDLHADPPFAAVLQATQRETVGAHEHQDLPFDEIARTAGAVPELGGNPLFQHMLVFHVPVRAAAIPGVRCALAWVPTHSAKLDLTLFVTDSRGALPCAGGEAELLLEFEYRTDLYRQSTMEELADRFGRVLREVTAEPPWDRGRPGPAPTAMEPAPAPALATLPELIRAAARHFPGRPALESPDGVVGHAELDAWSDRVAAGLRARGVGRGDRVAVLMHRSPSLVAAVLGVLKAGAAYVPIDLAEAPERIRYMLRDSACAMLIADRAGAEWGPATTVEELAASAGAEPPPLAAGGADEPAYLIYTSGSTGRPKGVLCAHRSVVNFVRWLNELVAAGPEDRVLLKAPLAFDASVRELFAPLAAGACVVLAAESGRADPEALARLLDHGRITILHAVPSLYAELLRQRPGMASLRHVVCGGEVLPSALLAEHRRCCPAVLHNVYGPTETTVDVTAWSDDGQEPDDEVPIGHPIAGHRVYLLDESLRPVPPGELGELHVAGPGVALGYWGQPALTAARFRPDPLSPEPGGRLYRTGDLGRLRPDGAIEFAGRRDRQVKLRGHRVELEEIEAVLLLCPAIGAAAVVPVPLGAGDTALAAYITVIGPAGPEAAIREFVEQRLPAALRPSRYVCVPELPRRPNGKVDYAALLAVPVPTPSEAPGLTPRELAVAAIFQALLGQRPATGADDFFALGGHSLLATQLAFRLRAAFGVVIDVRDVFEHPTLGQLADLVDARSLVTTRAGGSGVHPPLRPAPRPGREGAL